MIIGPWGKIITKASDKVGAIVADIDWDYPEDVSNKLPSLRNRVELKEM